METYILWSLTPGQAKTDLSFFASSVQAQRIQAGTPAMVKEMLEDLGIQNAAIQKWSLAHFATNYLADDPEDPDWEHLWTDTVAIQVTLAEPVNVEGGNTDLVRTYATDKSWAGNDQPTLPLRCVIIADFDTQKDAQAVADLMAQVGKRLEAGGSLAVQNHPQRVNRLLASLTEQLISLDKQDNRKPAITTSPRCVSGTQLAIGLGEFDASFYANGAHLAHTVEDICRAFNGAATWNESTDR